jgi:hypothetical protein
MRRSTMKTAADGAEAGELDAVGWMPVPGTAGPGSDTC